MEAKPRTLSHTLRQLTNRLAALFGYNLYTENRSQRLPKKSIAIRHLDGGSSNALEMELNALTSPVYDLDQYGIHFVASPRHADVLLITGPLTRSMEAAAVTTFRAMPEPRRVVTVGDGFAPNSLLADSYSVVPLPTELAQARVAHIPGDPPSPQQILEILLALPTR